MPSNCLHCAVKDLIKKRSESSSIDTKEIIMRLMEVIGDELQEVQSHKKRAEFYEYWGDLLVEIMHEIESGNYK